MFPWSKSQKQTAVAAPPVENGTRIELVYPQYLNVSMMMSSLAYIEGGVTWEEQRRTLAGKRSGTEKAGSAGLGVSPALSSLLTIDLKGNLASKLEEEHGEEVTLVKRHTETSLFMDLRSKLQRADLISPLADVIAGRCEDQPRRLVEVSGEVVRNPLLEVLALSQLLQPFVDAQTQQRQGQAKKAKPARQDNPNIAIAAKIKEGLDRSPLLDLILNPNDDASPTCVLTLSRAYLNDPSAEDLLGMNLTVLGRVTKVLREGQSINLLRRSVLGYAPFATREHLFDGFGKSPNLEMKMAEHEIRYPAVQILPMALFA